MKYHSGCPSRGYMMGEVICGCPSHQTQNICITFVQRWPNIVQILYICFCVFWVLVDKRWEKHHGGCSSSGYTMGKYHGGCFSCGYMMGKESLWMPLSWLHDG